MQRKPRIHLAQGKVTLVQSRLGRRLRQHGLARFEDYIRLVEADPGERGAVVMAATRQGVCSTAAAEPVPPAYRRAWMHARGDEMVMDEAARGLVFARVLNLFAPWPMCRQLDVISCRNVMIYYGEAAKAELEIRPVESLRPGGYLYIGHSERLVRPAATVMTSCGQTIYARPRRQV